MPVDVAGSATAPPHRLMPPEWAPHVRTWLAWPTANDTFGPEGGERLARARQAWGAVACAVAHHEPVTVVANPGDRASAEQGVHCRAQVVELPLDDAWIRDSGPTFVHEPDGGTAVVNWVFNGWGQQEWAAWGHDRDLARRVGELAGVPVVDSPLVLEGGGVHVDGQGTALVTETVLLDPQRNPGLSKEDAEAELRRTLGVERTVWLPRGLTADYGTYGTRGHVDLVAAFARPGVVLAHVQPDPAHPDHDVCAENLRLLRAATDARGRRLEVVEVPAPTVAEVDGELVDYSYVNFYLANGGVVLCGFDDPRDEEVAALFRRVFPERAVDLVDAREIFANGGGIHCITQQQPAARG
ncbi:agmatine deiminase [Kineococcus xinjiangensis]|uniref:Agmatine deiminase n=1 Tax=Kineococcus xinjiangensis TaxID=512762 RepID=A0A2S6II05_9ACTN|nr:agmatine deiminase family protein [Kineococcus xinjiangensis]PPK93828.1 agmatine deiminase [Kineococcus xinjiangensis]